jgi:putative resolvase
MDMLGVSTKTLQRWDAAEKIKMIRTLGGRRRVPASEVERLMGKISSQNEKHIAVYARVPSAEQKKKGDLSGP